MFQKLWIELKSRILSSVGQIVLNPASPWGLLLFSVNNTLYEKEKELRNLKPLQTEIQRIFWQEDCLIRYNFSKHNFNFFVVRRKFSETISDKLTIDYLYSKIAKSEGFLSEIKALSGDDPKNTDYDKILNFLEYSILLEAYIVNLKLVLICVQFGIIAVLPVLL